MAFDKRFNGTSAVVDVPAGRAVRFVAGEHELLAAEGKGFINADTLTVCLAVPFSGTMILCGDPLTLHFDPHFRCLFIRRLPASIFGGGDGGTRGADSALDAHINNAAAKVGGDAAAASPHQDAGCDSVGDLLLSKREVDAAADGFLFRIVRH